MLSSLYERWETTGILASEPATPDAIRRFEREYGVFVPDDLRSYFLTLNGTRVGECGGDDPYRVGFWHLDEVRPFAEAHLTSTEDADTTFAFADYFFRFGVYGIRLSADRMTPNGVVARFPYGTFVVAQTFSEFLTRYLLADMSVLFPDVAVTADEHGIGADAGGVVSYVVRWSEVRRIAIEVVVPKEAAAETVALWVITSGMDAPAFVAPVDTVAGGHVVRARVRSLPGFDGTAFEAARNAEARGITAEFVVWRAPGEPSAVTVAAQQ